MSPTITIACVSPNLAKSAVETVVTLPTFRRPGHLLETLASLAAQQGAPPFAVIVMENDDEGRQGLEAARSLFERGDMTGLVLIAHERGNCSAYNAGWQTALSEFPQLRHLLVIDDDELADAHWVARMVDAAARLNVDILGGPQVPRFETGARSGFERHPVFRRPYAVTGVVPILFSSGNVLIRRRVLDTMGAPFLDTAFNFIGGGDSDFYSRCRERGFGFGWCADAPVFETVPARRTEFSWLNARSLRNGAISAIIERRRCAGGGGAAKRLAKSLALLVASPWRSLRLGLNTGSATIGLYHCQVAVGRLMAEFGRVNEQYRQPERN
ncbi:glycosyltransferase [Jiella sp. MQZ9-1]|uniref:Glycosyltransferase n=1 Tax=Jiella flava TaxID=2816857 RepID=A0A939JR79_9HYPH|nr:glycosyltransferase [Jiella flava]MBO0661638.1 glycosyltransferase [Jiella flava]MCD2470280.1 glycosyltransferase [Jiella flava]